MKKLKMPELNTLQLIGDIHEAIDFYKSVLPLSVIEESGFMQLLLDQIVPDNLDLEEFNIEMLYRQEVADIKLFDFAANHTFTIECESKDDLINLGQKLSLAGKVIQPLTKNKQYYSIWLKDQFNLTWELLWKESI